MVIVLKDCVQQNLADGSLGEGKAKKIGREFLPSSVPKTLFNSCPLCSLGLSVRELATRTSFAFALL
jgi:hypothetical protein